MKSEIRMKKSLLIFVTFLIVFGCAKDLVESTVVYRGTRSSYERVLRNWTREGKLYREFDTRMLVWATLYSSDFVKAYLSEEARTRGWDQPTFVKKLSETERQYENVIPFQLAVLTHKKEWDDFDKPKSSWNLFLLTDLGERVKPIAIRRINLEPESVRIMFPYLSSWSSIYFVTFPAISPEGQSYWNDRTKFLSLVIAGPSGKLELVWKFSR